METTRQPLPPATQRFLDGLSDFIGSPLYYFGSVQRIDYFPGKSDVDIEIFADDEQTTMHKMAAYLHVPTDAFEKVVWKLNGRIIYGYKLQYERNQVVAEFSLFNSRYRDAVQREHLQKTVLPFWILALLYILKCIYYYLGIMPKSIYNTLKRFILNTLYHCDESLFLLLPTPSK